MRGKAKEVSAFRDQIKKDRAIFFNLDEFSALHEVDGRAMPCIIDNNELTERKSTAKANEHFDGLFLADLLIYVPADAFGALPKPQRVLTVDGKAYQIVDAIDEMGVYSIYLEANRA